MSDSLLISLLAVLCLLLFILAMNIYQRKKVERALRASEAKLRSFIDQAADAVLIWNHSGKIVDANRGACENLGYLREELLDLFITDIDTKFLEMTELKAAILQLKNRQTLTIETNYKCKNDTTLPVEVYIRLLQSDEAHLILGLARDISERKHAEKALRESEKLLREAQQIAHLGHWELDVVSNRLYWSDEIYRIFEADKTRFRKSYNAFLEMVHPDDREVVNKAYTDSIRNKTVYDITHRLLLPNGRIKYVHERCRHKYDDEGEIIYSMGTVHDITHVKEAEIEKKKFEKQLRQVQKLEAIGTLAGGIAHDFNNIITSILGYTELCQDLVDKGTILSENLNHIFDAGCRARDLVRQILTFSRQTEKNSAPIKIKPVIKEAVKLLRASLPSTIEIRKSIISNAVIQADATQIHQVIMNLCTNAAHAMRHGGGMLSIELKDMRFHEDITDRHLEMRAGNYVTLTVSDTGHGMRPEIMERIFEPFYTTKDMQEGTGLGLSVVHGIVKTHGGHISAYSEPGKGTTFNIYFPVTEESPTPGSIKNHMVEGGDERILVVDDEAVIAKMLRRMLVSLGYQVETSTNPIEALQRLENHPEAYDVVITDLTMPSMTGDRLAQRILEIREEMPIIICSGFSDDIMESALLEYGVSAFVRKPVLKNEIAKMIRKVLKKMPQETGVS